MVTMMIMVIIEYTEWTNKSKPLLNYHLILLKNLSIRLDFKIIFACKRCTRILSVGIIYSMRNLICGVIIYCASTLLWGKILSVYNAYDPYFICKTEKRTDGYQRIFT